MKIKRIICFIISVLMLAVSSLLISAAANEIKPVTFTINYVQDGVPVSDALFRLYYVAPQTPDGKYDAVGDFASFPVELNNLDTDGAVNAATALAGLVLYHNVKTPFEGRTDKNGILAFPGEGGEMKPGLYLLTGERKVFGDEAYTVTPTIYYLPSVNADGETVYNVEIVPKTEHKPIKENEKTNIGVIKTWKDKNLEYKRPENLTAVLFRDGSYYDSVILNKSNGWSYTWENLDSNHDWVVAEKTVSGYLYTVLRNGNTFIFSNTANHVPPSEEDTTNPTDTTHTTETTSEPSETTETTSTTESTEPPVESTTNPNDTTRPDNTETTKPREEIPNTGLLRWPITVFSIIGIFLLIIGWALIRKSSYEKKV